MEKELYFVFDEFMGKKIYREKNNSMEYMKKKPIKVSESNR
jgi:hypothetical protein